MRQRSMAAITLSWPRLRWPAWARRQAGPQARKISATSKQEAWDEPLRGQGPQEASRGTRARRYEAVSFSRAGGSSSKGLLTAFRVRLSTWL